MNDFVRCTVCDKWDWIRWHKCAPVWEARIYDEQNWEEDWSKIHATDAEAAAEEFCEQRDRDGEYEIIRSGCAHVEVRKPGEEAVTIFDVTAESVPQYSAREREP